jgi:hypothetical protein
VGGVGPAAVEAVVTAGEDRVLDVDGAVDAAAAELGTVDEHRGGLGLGFSRVSWMARMPGAVPSV